MSLESIYGHDGHVRIGLARRVICLRRREFIGALGGGAFWPLVGLAEHRKVPTTDVLNVPGGPPQYPLLLTDVTQGGYTTIRIRPPWNVAGVDYNVGPRATPTKTVAVNGTPAGCSISGNRITVNQSNLTISGWDFTPNGGYCLILSGVSNVTITDCLFNDCGAATSGAAPITLGANSGNGAITVQYCTFNGYPTYGINAVGVGMIGNCAAPLLVQYCRFTNWTDGGMGVGYTTTGLTAVTIQYCLFDRFKFDDATHSQPVNNANGTSNFTMQFCTVFQPVGDIAVAGGGYWPGRMSNGFMQGGNNANLTGNTISYNTGVCLGHNHRGSASDLADYGTGPWIDIHSNSGVLTNINPVVTNNYVTTSGNAQPKINYAGSLTGTNNSISGMTFSGNFNMQTGALLTA